LVNVQEIASRGSVLIAAFCRLDESLSHCRKKGWLVGAVGIEIEPPKNKP